MYVHTYICTYTHTHIHTYIHTYMHANMQTCKHTYMHIRERDATCLTNIHTCILLLVWHMYPLPRMTHIHAICLTNIHTCILLLVWHMYPLPRMTRIHATCLTNIHTCMLGRGRHRAWGMPASWTRQRERQTPAKLETPSPPSPTRALTWSYFFFWTFSI